MADLTITAANVSATSGSYTPLTGTAGATVTAGMPLYMDTGDNNHYKLAQSDGTALEATVKGISLHGASDGQPIQMATAGEMDLGATLTIGETYVLSQVAGKIAPVADLASGDYVCHLGIATDTDVLKISIVNSGVEVP